MLVGFTICISILVVTIYEKFEEGGWLTVARHRLARGPRLPRQTALPPRARAAAPARRHPARTSRVRPHEEPQTPIPRDEPVAVMLVSGFSGLGRPHGALRPEPLPAPVQELPLRVGRRHRLVPLQGSRGARGPEEADDRRPAEVRRVRAQARFPRRNALRHRPRGRGAGRRAVREDPRRVPAGDLLPRASSSSRTTSSTTGSCTTRRPSRSSAGSSSRACRRSCFRSGSSTCRGAAAPQGLLIMLPDWHSNCSLVMSRRSAPERRSP